MKPVLKYRLQDIEIVAGTTHPNAMKFKGVLVRVDEPSTKPPGGAAGHRIMIPTDVAQRQLHTLLNMGLNYDPDLDAHAQRRKVGTITKAWIDGKDVRVEGVVWKHDFPEAEKDLKQPGLGMSMELVDVDVEDPDAKIWTLTNFHFSGATILYRESAAYFKTQAIAAKADKGAGTMAKTQQQGKKVPTVRKVDSEADRIARIVASVTTKVLAETNKPLLSIVSRQTKTLGQIAAAQEALAKKLTISTSAKDEHEDIDASDADEIEADGDMEDMDSAKGGQGDACDDDDADADDEDGEEGDDDEVDAEAGGVDKGDLEDLGDAGGDGAEPGHRNDDTKNHGSDTAVQDKVGKTVSSAAFKKLQSDFAQLKKKFEASTQANDKLLKRVNKQDKQLEAAADRVTRRSLDPQIVALLAKHQVDANDLIRSGEKLAVAEVDAVLAAAEKDGVRLTPTDRVTIKNKMVDQGIMDEGRVDRRSVR